MKPQKIAILGAECTGKSVLASTLATAMQGIVVPEILRAWCDAHQRTPQQSEQRTIFDLQLQAEHNAYTKARAHNNAHLFCDTTPLSVAIHSLHYFNDDTLLAAAITHQRGYAMTLLCDVDVPWLADGIQRDGPEVRAQVHARLLKVLHENAIAATLVSGDGARRTAHALSAVQWAMEA